MRIPSYGDFLLFLSVKPKHPHNGTLGSSAGVVQILVTSMKHVKVQLIRTVTFIVEMSLQAFLSNAREKLIALPRIKSK